MPPTILYQTALDVDNNDIAIAVEPFQIVLRSRWIVPKAPFLNRIGRLRMHTRGSYIWGVVFLNKVSKKSKMVRKNLKQDVLMG